MLEPIDWNNEVISDLQIMLAAARLYRVVPNETAFELERATVEATGVSAASPATHLLTGKETYTLRFTVDTHRNPGDE